MHEEARSDMALADVLGSWSSQSGPLYRQLASAIRAAAARGELAPGDVLPAERSLAADLAVGRSTVVHAYDLLRSEGVLESRQGSGTWIAGAERRGPAAGSGSDALRRAALQASSGIIDLATASFSAAPTVREAIASMATLVPPELLEGSGYEPMGLLALRDAVARHYAQDGLPTTPEQVLVTTGTQQALAIIVDQVVLPGDSVLVEDPTSPGVLDLLRARPVALRTTRSLASVGAEPLLDMTARSSPSLTYLMLAYGPEGRRVADVALRRVSDGLATAAGIVVEDASSRDLWLSAPASYLAAQPRAGRVLTVGSMSKLFWGGLRVGWIRGDVDVMHRLSRAKARADLGTPLLSQVVAAYLLDRAQDVRAQRVRDLQERLDLASDVLGAELPEFGWDRPDGGLTIWLTMPAGTSSALAEVARRHGVAVVPGASLSPDGSADSSIRVSLAPPADVFAAGISRLAQAWHDYERIARGSGLGATREAVV